MISKKRLSVFRLPLWGRALVRIAGKNLSEKELTDLHRNKFRNIFVCSFFATDPWFAKRYLEVLREKIDTKTLLFRMRNRLIRAGLQGTKRRPTV